MYNVRQSFVGSSVSSQVEGISNEHENCILSALDARNDKLYCTHATAFIPFWKILFGNFFAHNNSNSKNNLEDHSRKTAKWMYKEPPNKLYKNNTHTQFDLVQNVHSSFLTRTKNLKNRVGKKRKILFLTKRQNGCGHPQSHRRPL